ncbi:MAG: hypothetical protein Q9227_002584 [Pyrenula ochraceoflavens]
MSIATIKGDLSNITAPPFVLATKSAVEFPAYWAEHPSTFTAPAAAADPQERALLVLKWFLAALKQQQYAGRDEKEGVKKPLNAFLGEVFLARWEGDGVTELVSEQVSHHPPVTACYLWNDKHGVRAEGYTCQEVTFSGSVNVAQIGHAILHIDAYNEDYLIPLPSVKVSGILTGTPYPELKGTYYIPSSNGFVSEISFTGKKLFTGKKNAFHASLYREGDSGNPLYSVEGQWNDKFTIHDETAQKDLETYDVNTPPEVSMSIAPLSEQDPWETRTAWSGVISALERGDMQGVSDEKNKLEQAQRDMRKKEEKGGMEWHRAFFKREEEHQRFERLAKMVPGVELGKDKTEGIWRVNDEKAKRMREGPVHQGLTPFGYDA